MPHNPSNQNYIFEQVLAVNRQSREDLNGHTGKLVWFTGLSGAGKSTLANALELELHRQRKHTYLLDGDNLRQGLNQDLGFSEEDRIENIRRVSQVAKLMVDAGLIVLAAFISPFKQQRQMIHDLIGQDRFIEVYVNTPLEVCEARDNKGLYKLARQGKIENMTGLNSPFEQPDQATLVIDSRDEKSISQFLQKILPSLS